MFVVCCLHECVWFVYRQQHSAGSSSETISNDFIKLLDRDEFAEIRENLALMIQGNYTEDAM